MDKCCGPSEEGEEEEEGGERVEEEVGGGGDGERCGGVFENGTWEVRTDAAVGDQLEPPMLTTRTWRDGIAGYRGKLARVHTYNGLGVLLLFGTRTCVSSGRAEPGFVLLAYVCGLGFGRGISSAFGFLLFVCFLHTAAVDAVRFDDDVMTH